MMARRDTPILNFLQKHVLPSLTPSCQMNMENILKKKELRQYKFKSFLKSIQAQISLASNMLS